MAWLGAGAGNRLRHSLVAEPTTRGAAVTDDRMGNKRALVRRPGPRLAEGLVSHRIPAPVDLDLAERQWHGYVDSLRAEGWELIEVPPADDCPDAVFVEDTVVVHGDLAVISRPGADERKPEIAGTEATLASLGFRISRIEAPGTLDGGDVLKVQGVVFVGVSGRTNASGAEQLAKLLRPLSVRVVAVPVSRVLHLKSCVTALPDGTIVGFAPLVDEPGLWPSFLSVPEEAGAHVVVLDSSAVLMSTRAPATRAIFESRGLSVVAVDISEYEKLDGSVTCLSVRLRG
jgi:dimethylargininase